MHTFAKREEVVGLKLDVFVGLAETEAETEAERTDDRAHDRVRRVDQLREAAGAEDRDMNPASTCPGWT